MVDPLAQTLPDATPHLAKVRAALARLGSSELTAPARAALAEAQLALQALESLHWGSVDRTVFDALMVMAGPDVAPELMAQMETDLRATATQLATGLQDRDWAAIRSQTHVLVALAGSAGARGLEQASRALNRAAHEADADRLHALGPSVQAGLHGLIRFVATARTGSVTPP